MSENRAFLGIVFFIGANFLTALVNAIAKYLSLDIHALLVTWGYFVGMTVVVIGYAVATRMRPAAVFATKRLGMQLLRALLLVLTLWTLFVGLTFIPLADAVAIVFAAPLIITALSGPLLGERVGPHRWGAVLVGLVGVGCVDENQ